MEKILLDEETLFKEEDAFSFDYVPEIFNFRESQLSAIAASLRPAIRNKKASNLLLLGKPGTGKTTAIKVISQQLDGPILVHINSKIYSSPFRIFSEIHKKLFGYLPPDTGIPLPTIYDKIFKKVVKEKRYLLVILDDIQYLLSDMNKILYDMLRANEVFEGVGVSVIGITDKSIMHKLDDKVRSVFQPDEIRFLPYTEEEIYKILLERREIGLYPGTMNDSILKAISSAAYKKGDLRFGIENMRKAAVNAEANASRTITRKHLNLSTKEDVPEEGSGLVSLIPTHGIKSGELFLLVKEKMGYTKFYKLLQKLETSGHIETQSLRGIGNSRLIKRK
jgi:archaeal cell division control protein 6